MIEEECNFDKEEPVVHETADFYEYLAQLEYIREHFNTVWHKDM